MIFTVVWTEAAAERLANLWLHAPDRQAVADSADRIDRELRVDAHKKGFPLRRFRVLNDDPLAVLYSVEEGDRMVRVISVRFK